MMKKIKLEGAYNFRDIGGYSGKNGKKIKKGVLYRSDELSHLTEKDIEVLEKLNIQTIIDFRNEKERLDNEDKQIGEANLIYLDPKADTAALASAEGKDIDLYDRAQLTSERARFFMTKQNKEFVINEESKKAYKKMFEIILDSKNQAIVQHCRGGKDRTGYGVALIQLLLGVSKEDVLYDYLLTNEYKKEKNEKSLRALLQETGNEDLVEAFRLFKEANLDFISEALRTIEEHYGNVETYVIQELGLTKKQIEKLEEMYLEED